MAAIEVSAEPRSVVGKKVRFLRRQGLVPANIYGQSASTAVTIPSREAEHAIRRAGRTQLITLAVKGGATDTVLLKTWQRHPYRGDLLHLDFQRIAMTEVMRIDVPIRLVGEAPAIKTTGGMLFQSTATVSVECLPANIPEAIEADVSGLEEVDASIFVRDLSAPQDVTIVTDGDELVVRVRPPTVEREGGEEEAAEGEAAAEGGEAATGEAASTDESADES